LASGPSSTYRHFDPPNQNAWYNLPVRFGPVSAEAVVTNDFASDTPEVVPFAPFARNAAPNSDDPLDSAGQGILILLQRAARIAEENKQRALSVAHELSLQLRTAEDRIKDLEADVRHYRDRADRAEKWLYQIAQEIEQRFFPPADSRPPQASIQQAGPRDFARKK
jgi:hypothetical protein